MGKVFYYISHYVWRIVAPSKPVEESIAAASDKRGFARPKLRSQV